MIRTHANAFPRPILEDLDLFCMLLLSILVYASFFILFIPVMKHTIYEHRRTAYLKYIGRYGTSFSQASRSFGQYGTMRAEIVSELVGTDITLDQKQTSTVLYVRNL
jgi:hypothetical protein